MMPSWLKSASVPPVGYAPVVNAGAAIWNIPAPLLRNTETELPCSFAATRSTLPSLLTSPENRTYVLGPEGYDTAGPNEMLRSDVHVLSDPQLPLKQSASA